MVNAGELRDRVAVLELVKEAGADGGAEYRWAERRKIWARAELMDKTCLFSSVGIGARRVEFTIRRRELTLHQAFRWNGRHCFLSSIVPDGPGHLKVTAALVELADCVGNANRHPGGRGSRRC